MNFDQDIPCYLLTATGDRRIRTASRMLLEDTGYTVEELQAQVLDDLLDLGGRIFLQTHVLPMLSLHTTVNEIDLTLRCKDGSTLPVLMNARLLERDGEQLVVLSGLQIPERAKFEKELREARRKAEDDAHNNEATIRSMRALNEAQQKLDRGSSSLAQRNRELAHLNELLSHDLQEPIRKIALHLDRFITARQSVLTTEDVAQLTRIMEICRQMRDTLISLHNFTSLMDHTAGTGTVDLHKVLTDVTNAYHAEIERMGIRVTMTGLPESVPGSYALYFLLFKNLFDNSVKFRDHGKEVTTVDITATIVEENFYRHVPDKYEYVPFARITVSDNGIGFDERRSEYLFSLFRQGDTTLIKQGAGLGLALARKIVESNFGTIHAESDIGRGTTIVIMLPLQKPRQ